MAHGKGVAAVLSVGGKTGGLAAKGSIYVPRIHGYHTIRTHFWGNLLYLFPISNDSVFCTFV